jgi:hypothetical protein
LSWVSVLTSDAFWIALGSFGAIFTLALTYQQMKRADLVASADFLLKLNDKFDQPDMLEERKKIMTIFKKDPKDFKEMDKHRKVFDFFDDLGLLLKIKAIPKPLVWSSFCYWIQHYWTAFKDYVMWVRDDDITVYGNFQYLSEEIQAYDERICNPPKHLPSFLSSRLPLFLRRRKHVKIEQKELERFADEEIEVALSKRQ